VHTRVIANNEQAVQIIDDSLATVRHATRTAVHRSIGNSPVSLAFHRNMFLPIPVIADLQAIRDRRQLQVDAALVRENKRRHFRDYTVGDQVLVLDQNKNRRKLDPTASGPYTVDQVFANGTLMIMRNEHVYERINIRRLRPYQVHQL
jgi:hypothetical protein